MAAASLSKPCASWRPACDQLAALLAPSGLDIVQPFPLQALNAAAAGLSGVARPPLPTFGRPCTLGILVGNSAALWQPFVAWLAADADARLAQPDPLDAYVRATLEAALEQCTALAGSQLRFSHDTGHRFVDMQLAARASGLAAFCSASHLCWHPTFGPWFALRAVVCVDREGPADAPPQLELPYPDIEADSAAAVQRLMQGNGSGVRSSDWREWAALRALGARYTDERHAYCADQLAYHYTKDKGFSWTKAWYPVASVRDTEPQVPQPIDLLGAKLVLWSDTHGAWHAQQDLCPHRLAPLSEGKVVGDEIQCSYHGWRFSGGGACTRIPQATPEVQARACANPRSCVRAYPTRVAHGLIWVWPDVADARWVDAEAAPVAQDVPPAGDEWLTFLPLYVREFPYSVQTLFDNTLDPAHVPWSHHGVIGNRDKAVPMGMKVHQDVSPLGVAVECETNASQATATRTYSNAQGIHLVVSFKAPHTLVYDITRLDGTRGKLLSYVTPTRPGWCTTHSVSLDTQRSPANLLSARMPGWAAHTVFMEAGAGDVVLLKAQEELLPKLRRGWREFWLPTDADVGVTLWRRWLERYTNDRYGPYQLAAAGAALPESLKEGVQGGGAAGIAADALRGMTREQLLDRWTQHTSTCKACRAAMAAFECARWAALAAAAVAAQVAFACALQLLPPCSPWTLFGGLLPVAGVAIGGLSVSARVVGTAVWTALAAVMLALAAKSGEVRQAFLYKDYVHAQR